MDNEERLHDMKVQLTTVQGNHKESMEQLGDKSQQVAMLRTEISRTQQQNQAMSEDVRLLWITSLRYCFIHYAGNLSFMDQKISWNLQKKTYKQTIFHRLFLCYNRWAIGSCKILKEKPLQSHRVLYSWGWLIFNLCFGCFFYSNTMFTIWQMKITVTFLHIVPPSLSCHLKLI